MVIEEIMVHPKRVRRDNDQLPVWLQRCKALLEGRALAIAAPLALTLVFGLIFTLHQAPYVNQNPNTGTPGTQHHLPGMQSQAANLALDSTDASPDQTTDPSREADPPATKPAPSTAIPSSSPSLAANDTGSRVLGAANTVCNAAAKDLATITKQAAITAENARHSKLVSQIEANTLLGSLLSTTNLAAEDMLHMLNLQKIATIYTQQLQAANCT